MQPTIPAKRGGAGRGQGRKAGPEGGLDATLPPMRVTAAQRDKLAQLGGPAWVRRMIDEAQLPGGALDQARRDDRRPVKG